MFEAWGPLRGWARSEYIDMLPGKWLLAAMPLLGYPSASIDPAPPGRYEWRLDSGADRAASPFVLVAPRGNFDLPAGSRGGAIASARSVVDWSAIENSGAPCAGGSRVVVDGADGWVRSVSVTLPPDAAMTVVEAYSETGILLGTARGGPAATVKLSFPGRIHRVVIKEAQGVDGSAAPVVVAPGPATLAALGIAVLAPIVSRRRPALRP